MLEAETRDSEFKPLVSYALGNDSVAVFGHREKVVPFNYVGDDEDVAVGSLDTFSLNKNINDVIITGGGVSYLAVARPTTQYGREWQSEVLHKALEEKVDDRVNLDAYGYKCERNTRLAYGAKEVSLLTVEEVENGLRGVADTVASYLDVNIDVIVESSEVQTLVAEFLEVHYHIASTEAADLWGTLTLARKSNVKMLEKLRDLISRYSIENIIEGVLTNRDCLMALERVLA